MALQKETTAHRVRAEFGQSLWYDNVKRSALVDGSFKALLEAGVTGCTSNPTIFHKAITGSSDYDAALSSLARAGHEPGEIYYRLVVEDIQAVADQLRPIYERSNFEDGYVSVEVSPKHSHDSDATVKEAVELHSRIARDNIMIKVPATTEGLTALTELIARGISVNVTLIFSVAQYETVAKAYIAGLERAAAAGIKLETIASVASVFVSRIDAKVDAALSSDSPLLGRIAIANAKIVYETFQSLFGGAQFQALAQRGAQKQRVLWASTGTKNPAFKDTLYVDELIGPDTVNTIPPATLDAFLLHGTPGATLGAGLETAKSQLDSLASLGVNLGAICDDLLQEGLQSFEQSIDALMEDIASRARAEQTQGGSVESSP